MSVMASRPSAAFRALASAARSGPAHGGGVWQAGGVLPCARRALHTTPRAAAVDEAPNAAAAAADAAPAAPRVCIVGGGFGGLYTAVKLETLIWPKGKKPRVTLIDQGERFVFKPLLYELLNGTAQPWEVAPTFTQLLAPYPVQFIQASTRFAKVAGVETDGPLADGGSASGGRVLLEGGAAVEYDWLVVALGAETDPKGVPGAKELARPFATLEDATFVGERLAELETAAAAGGVGGAAGGAAPRSPVVAVVGAGYAGVELASVIGERVQGRGVAVKMVTPGDVILAGSPEGQREAARKVLDDLGVEVVTGAMVGSLSRADDGGSGVDGGGGGAGAGADSGRGRCVLNLEGGGGGGWQLEADLVIWTAGSSPASKFVKVRGARNLAAGAGTGGGANAWGPSLSLPFPSSPTGAIETDPTLRVRKHARAFALGDVSFTSASAAAAAEGDEQQQQQQQQQQQAAAAYPNTAQVAFQQADYAAWNVWAAINGRPLLPFRYQHLGSMMSLGAANAAVALPVELPEAVAATLKGSPLESLLGLAGVRAGARGGVTLDGPLAQLLRRAAYLYRQPTNEQRLSVAASWVQQAADVAARLAQQLADQQQGPAGVGSSSDARR
ncbi:NADH dehydrogenase [Monoraphidium neglectum]|uniref:NADH dehydrogenase n=1 Tax=Monoraphidium neglectum TaxID=145388 RepID=A0A0D2MMW1_9CHLO|nr:NADH dehydrogenase [Monoraphidium neglectum]KIZ01897.1 NADH dehydrogenase [Monoraphidium neglectum]|eukprot:XP_013900916.1 NADH dehydrogenase [Monoraphidium neglectum]